LTRQGDDGNDLREQIRLGNWPLLALGLVEMALLHVLSSVQRDSHAHARPTRIHACASRHSLVAVARAHDLPPEAPARAAHAHTT